MASHRAKEDQVGAFRTHRNGIDMQLESASPLQLMLDEQGFRVLRSPRSPRYGSFPNRESLSHQRDSDAAALVADVVAHMKEAHTIAMLEKSGSQSSIASDVSSKSSASSISITMSTRHQISADELSKRSQKRVTDVKRSEHEKRQEQEKLRLQRREQASQQKEQTKALKARRRAEIYALNAIMRRLQQEKIARFISAQQRHAIDASVPLAPSIGV